MSRSVEWFTPSGNIAVGAVGAGAESTLIDVVIDEPTTGDLYGGTIVGGQVYITLDAAVAITKTPSVWLLLLPSGLPVPACGTELARWQQQDFHWIASMFTLATSAGSRSLQWAFKLATKRSFNRGDRLVAVIRNNDVVGFGAAATARFEIDAYLVLD